MIEAPPNGVGFAIGWALAVDASTTLTSDVVHVFVVTRATGWPVPTARDAASIAGAKDACKD